MSVHNVRAELFAAESDGKARQYRRTVLLAANTAVSQGRGLCYLREYGTASAADESRDRRVSLPDHDNYLSFAGVAARDVASSSQEQWIEIYEPGSVCLIDASGPTIGQDTILTCTLSAYATDSVGRFIFPGFWGRGSARIMQTPASGLALAELLTGPESGLVDFHPLEQNGVSGGARTTTQYGLTVIEGPAQPPEDITLTLADGEINGMRKQYYVKGGLVTNDWLVTVTTGVQMDGSTQLQTIELDAADEFATLEWHAATHWQLVSYVGTLT